REELARSLPSARRARRGLRGEADLAPARDPPRGAAEALGSARLISTPRTTHDRAHPLPPRRLPHEARLSPRASPQAELQHRARRAEAPRPRGREDERGPPPEERREAARRDPPPHPR